VNKVANQYPSIHVPQVPDVPEVPKINVPHVPEVPEVPMVSEFVWQTYYTPLSWSSTHCQTTYFDLLQENFFNKVLTKIFVGMI